MFTSTYNLFREMIWFSLLSSTNKRFLSLTYIGKAFKIGLKSLSCSLYRENYMELLIFIWLQIENLW